MPRKFLRHTQIDALHANHEWRAPGDFPRAKLDDLFSLGIAQREEFAGERRE